MNECPNRLKKLSSFLLCLCFPVILAAGQDQDVSTVETYPWASSIPVSDKYAVSVQGSAQHVIPTEEPHLCTFGCQDTVEVVISLLDAKVRRAAVRPLHKHAIHSIRDGKLMLRMAPFDQFVVELDGKKEHPLFLFANPPEQKPQRDSCVYYFEAGTVTDTTLLVDSGKVYIEGGAWVNGFLHAFGAENLEIGGYGILNNTIKERPFFIKNSSHVSVDGLLLINRDYWSTFAAESSDLTFNNYKVVAPASSNAHGHENDALDILGCQHVRISKCFTYCHDDALCIKSQKWNYAAPVRDVVCEDCTIWNYHNGSGIEIGWETNQDCSDVHFKNIWCVRSGGDMTPAMCRAGISVKHCAGGHLSDFTFEDIFIEDALEYGIFFGIYKSTANIGNKVEWKPGTMEGFLFRNVHIDGPAPYGSASVGYDGGMHSVKGVRFEGLFRNGREVGSDPSRFFRIYKDSDITLLPITKIINQ